MPGLGWALNPVTGGVLIRGGEATGKAVVGRRRQKWRFSTTSQGMGLSALKAQPHFVTCPDCLKIRHYLYHLLLFLFRSKSVSTLYRTIFIWCPKNFHIPAQ